MSFLRFSTGSPVVCAVARQGKIGKIHVAMNSTKRLVFGVISSLLLAAGFVRAADRLDPMTNSLRISTDNNTVGIAVPCTVPCDIASQTT
jgi:hypothetical protein